MEWHRFFSLRDNIWQTTTRRNSVWSVLLFNTTVLYRTTSNNLGAKANRATSPQACHGQFHSPKLRKQLFWRRYILMLQIDSLAPDDVFKKVKYCSFIIGCWDTPKPALDVPALQMHTPVNIWTCNKSACYIKVDLGVVNHSLYPHSVYYLDNLVSPICNKDKPAESRHSDLTKPNSFQRYSPSVRM